MEKRIEVTVLRDHRNGYAPSGFARKGDVLIVPADRVRALELQKLAKVAKAKTATKDEGSAPEPEAA